MPVGRGDRDVDAPSYELVYPEGARDAESLLADPATGRLYVVSKGVFGGTLYAAPERLSAEPAQPARRRSGRCWAIATDAAFFPDGRHMIVRNYSEAAVYSWPELNEVGRFGLPDQQQGEGIAVAATARSTPRRRGCTRRCCGSPCRPPYAGQWSRRAPRLDSRDDRHTQRDAAARHAGGHGAARAAAGRRSAWGWALGGLLGLGIVVVLVRALRPR